MYIYSLSYTWCACSWTRSHIWHTCMIYDILIRTCGVYVHIWNHIVDNFYNLACCTHMIYILHNTIWCMHDVWCIHNVGCIHDNTMKMLQHTVCFIRIMYKIWRINHNVYNYTYKFDVYMFTHDEYVSRSCTGFEIYVYTHQRYMHTHMSSRYWTHTSRQCTFFWEMCVHA